MADLIYDDLFDGVVTPSDCALLVALPLTFDEFREDVVAALGRNPGEMRGDFAAVHSIDKDVRGIEGGWHAFGAPTAAQIAELLQHAESVGVGHVVSRTDGSALNCVFQARPKVVILIAHWRSTGVRDRDLVPRFASLAAQRLEGEAGDVAASLAAVLQQVNLASGGSPRNRAVAAALNRWVREDGFIRVERRLQLDCLLEGLIVPGEAVELRDGYYSAEAAAALLPSDWAGIIDLGVCTSMRLAQALKAERDDRRVIAGIEARYPMRCLPEFHETLLHLANKAQSYMPLRVKIHRIYSGLMGDCDEEPC